MVRRVALLVVVCSVAFAGDFQEALNNYNKNANDKDPSNRAAAVERLGSSTEPKHDMQTAQLVLKSLISEIDRGRKSENDVSLAVLDACSSALTRITDARAIEYVAGAFKSVVWRAKIYMMEALAGYSNDKAKTAFLSALDDREPSVVTYALHIVAKKGVKDAIDKVLAILQDVKRPWETRTAAAECIRDVGDEKCNDALLKALGEAGVSEARVKSAIIEALQKINDMKEFDSENPDDWKVALADKKANGGGDVKNEGTGVRPTTFYGLKVKSQRIIFILDITGSMGADASYPEEEEPPVPKEVIDTGKKSKIDPTDSKKKRKLTEQEIAAMNEAQKLLEKYAKMAKDKNHKWTRIEVLKAQFIKTLFYMDPSVKFTIITYNIHPKLWCETLQDAIWTIKLEAMREVDKIKEDGGTGTWDALELAYKTMGQPGGKDAGPIKVDKGTTIVKTASGADTFFLLTDGEPNYLGGRQLMSEAEIPGLKSMIIDNVKKLTPIRKIVINTICIGDPGDGAMKVDPDFLRKIAEATGGQFKHVKDK